MAFSQEKLSQKKPMREVNLTEHSVCNAGKKNIEMPQIFVRAKALVTFDSLSDIAIRSFNDHETIEKARPVYDALYTNCKLKLVRDKHEDEIEKMDREQRREFLKKQLMEYIPYSLKE
jgi:hypothetical protein